MHVIFDETMLSQRFGPEVQAKVHRHVLQLRKAYDEVFADYDVLVTPTAPTVAPPHPDMSPATEGGSTVLDKAKLALGAMNNTCQFNATGHPALSVPCGWATASDGQSKLPVGMQLVGRRWDDLGVLQAARVFEMGGGGLGTWPGALTGAGAGAGAGGKNLQHTFSFVVARVRELKDEGESDGSSAKAAAVSDYDLNIPISSEQGGLRSNLPGYGDTHFSLFLRKVFIKALGYTDESLSKPIIGIINTFSSFNPCHAQVPRLLEAAKRGILLAGGLPMEFPTISVHESFSNPTSMYLRNLMSMDTEEMVKSQPVDAVVMIGGCDKTVPAQLMGGISANKPFLPLITGPMMPGSVKGVRVGACTDCRNSWAKYRAGAIDIEDIMDVNEELAPTAGTCGVMGTASTMACITAGLGLIDLKSGATSPAVSSTRLRVAENTGKTAVAILRDKEGFRPQKLLAYENFINAIIVLQAIGGSTNAIVHLMAIINRHPDVRGRITLKTFDEIGRKTPLLVDLKPSGDNYMTDFHNAGGMLALMHTLRPLLHLNARTFTGQTLDEMLDSTPFQTFDYSKRIVRSLDDPLHPSSSLAVLYGNLAPDGAVMKASASKDRRLLKHRGRACVFKNSRDLSARIDSDDLDVTADSILVLQGIGPVGNPGMPEAGLIPIPRKLGRSGVTDMLRISDGRMSGTAGGTIVLHVSPESADPESVLGIVQDGDYISCDVEARMLHLEIEQEEIKMRIAEREEMKASRRKVIRGGKLAADVERDPWHTRRNERGYRGLYERHVNQAHLGCDFDFLTAEGPRLAEEEGSV
ncbi:uncharacterized protein E0L32_011179 [Thyridium curvatum]|uniref:Uncharacterized protein n=1 Tax=Thyridium curvatum TaxID=1093900 RepID=A0A507BI34_9PEZI|nr:uncharacterized protein E0L32_011179 [Thyridium curvatum]TPX19106.1 hypothetical protein E0L32_011179 [Thyridium curvatum]